MTRARLDARREGVQPLLDVALAFGLLFHGVLLVSGSSSHTFDAWIHLFFADHDARSWSAPDGSGRAAGPRGHRPARLTRSVLGHVFQVPAHPLGGARERLAGTRGRFQAARGL